MMNTARKRGMPQTALRVMRTSSTRRPNMTMRMRAVSMTLKTTAGMTAYQMLSSARGRSDHTVNSIN
jgi:hypothetical protein